VVKVQTLRNPVFSGTITISLVLFRYFSFCLCQVPTKKKRVRTFSSNSKEIMKLVQVAIAFFCVVSLSSGQEAPNPTRFHVDEVILRGLEYVYRQALAVSVQFSNKPPKIKMNRKAIRIPQCEIWTG
jgi:hypothetical protein